MAKVEYDLDTSGGLMEKIQALIAPPTSDPRDKARKVQHPYFKRPGKGHNHDSCDACGEGGDLICCDKCPSSFHLLCYDPPLEAEDIPRGNWLCHTCQYHAAKEREEKASTSGTLPRIRNKRTASAPDGGTPAKQTRKSKATNPLELLLEAANSLNPTQFELPRSMSVPCLFPGSDKIEQMASRRNYKYLRRQFEKSNGNGSSLPTGKCYECRRTCRFAPLLSCDYCPLMFHLDCLDPPLASPPSGRWMCPNHVEHCLDEKLLTSVSATERIQLWDKFSGPVDQDIVKVQFFRKVRSANPPFRVKVKLAPRNRVSVPDMVRYHYKNPPELIPSLRDVLRLEYLESREDSIFVVTDKETEPPDIKELCQEVKVAISAVESINVKVQEEDEEEHISRTEARLNGVFELTCEGEQALDHVLHPPKEEVEPDDKSTIGKVKENEPAKKGKGKTRMKKGKVKDAENEVDSKDFEINCNRLETEDDWHAVNGLVTKDAEKAYLHNGVHNLSTVKNEEFAKTVANNVSEDVEQLLKQLDDRILNVLAYQRIQELLLQTDSPNTHFTSVFSNVFQSKLTHMSLPSDLLTPDDIDKISRLFSSSKKASPKKVSNIRTRAILCPIVSKHFYNIRTTEVNLTQIRHDASFLGYRPTVSNRFPEAASMCYRTLTIGKGSANDVQLDRYGHCNFTHPKHAVIFYDEMSQQYELLNYSGYGTLVNNVLYSNDERDKTAKKAEKQSVEDQVRDVVDKKRNVTRPKDRHCKMTAVEYLNKVECSCNQSSYEDVTAGWEGSAVLSHGSLLRFGCICFIFSIVDGAVDI